MSSPVAVAVLIAEGKGYFTAEAIVIIPVAFRRAGHRFGARHRQARRQPGRDQRRLLQCPGRNLDLRAVAALGIQPSPVIATPPVARKDLSDSGAIRSGADFKGHKVAVNVPGSIPNIFSPSSSRNIR